MMRRPASTTHSRMVVGPVSRIAPRSRPRKDRGDPGLLEFDAVHQKNSLTIVTVVPIGPVVARKGATNVETPI